MEYDKFSIKTSLNPGETLVKIDDKPLKGLYGFSLNQTVEEIPQLVLDCHVLDIARFEGEGLIKYDFSLPDDKKTRKALYEQLKDEFEEK